MGSPAPKTRARPNTRRNNKPDLPDYTEWGKRVAYWRDHNGWSQTRLAALLSTALDRDVDQAAVSRIERGVRPPGDAVRIALARLLGAPVYVLFPFPADVT